MTNRNKRRYFGKCDCGGRVYGEMDFGRWWTWCNKCTPEVTVKLPQPRHHSYCNKETR